MRHRTVWTTTTIACAALALGACNRKTAAREVQTTATVERSGDPVQLSGCLKSGVLADNTFVLLVSEKNGSGGTATYDVIRPRAWTFATRLASRSRSPARSREDRSPPAKAQRVKRPEGNLRDADRRDQDRCGHQASGGDVGETDGRGVSTVASAPSDEPHRATSGTRIAISCAARGDWSASAARENAQARGLPEQIELRNVPVVVDRPQQLDPARRIEICAEPVEQQVRSVRRAAHISATRAIGRRCVGGQRGGDDADDDDGGEAVRSRCDGPERRGRDRARRRGRAHGGSADRPRGRYQRELPASIPASAVPCASRSPGTRSAVQATATPARAWPIGLGMRRLSSQILRSSRLEAKVSRTVSC